MIRIVDSTLREGCQSAAGRFTIEQSQEIARLLRAAGVDMIECGHASIDAEELRRIAAVTEVVGNVPVLSHARACPLDVDRAAESGASWVGIFLGCNSLTRKARLPGRSRRELLRMARESVSRARRRGLQIRFTVEDASRTPLDLMLDQFRVALESGADRLCIADTIGLLEPPLTSKVVCEFRERFPEVPLEVHMHDDRGLALANVLAAVDAGATWVSTSVNGLGERAGITDLAALELNLHVRGDRLLTCGESLQELSRRVGAYSRSRPDFRRPVVGRDAFTHASRLHRLAMQRDTSAYELVDPAIVGRSRIIELPESRSEEAVTARPSTNGTSRSVSSPPREQHSRFGSKKPSRVVGDGEDRARSPGDVKQRPMPSF